MIVLAGLFRFDPAQLALARPAFAAIIEASRAEEGCVAYSFGLDAVESGVVHVFEVWRDDDALAFHRASPHMAAWRSRHAEIGMHGRDLALYRVSGHERVP